MEEGKNKKIFLITTIVLSVVLLVGGFFLFKYYKKATLKEAVINEKISTSVKEAEDKKTKELNADYEKKTATLLANPWKEFKTDDFFGPIDFKYPKDWHDRITNDSGSVDEFVFLADPDWIIDTRGEKGPFTALVFKVIDKRYEAELKVYQNKNKPKKTVYDIKEINLSGISGSRINGVNNDTGKNIEFVLIPYRDKTFYMGTEDKDRFGSIYNEILSSLVLNK